MTPLENVRTRLLDLTLANRLLHFRHTKRSALRVVDELPDVLWARLLREGDELLFLPVPEPPVSEDPAVKRPAPRDHAETLGVATDFDLPVPPPDDAKPKASHRDNKVQTLLYPSDLETTLRTLTSAARSAVDETGTNMLHLVFGFLEWNEREHPDKKLLAPLLTLPVTLRRGDVDPRTRTYRFHVSHSGEDVATNVSLQEKMRRDFGVEIPPLNEDETPEAYFPRVAQAVSPVEGWCVRRQITLCLLSFGKQLMFRDLDPERWPEGAGPLQHPRVRELFEGTERTPYDVSHEYPLDDASVVPDLPPIVVDADSSQHSALVDVLRGRNLVIQGPPGTGKSQTIANLLAAAMVRGKTVLFIAEKLAALEVVRRRLDQVGLGHFCLELHSHKTQKHRLLKDLALRLEARGTFEDAQGLDDKLALLADTRAVLTAHAERIHAPASKLGWTVFDVLWGRALRSVELAELLPEVKDTEFPDPSDWTLATLEATKTSVEAFAAHLLSIRARAPRWIDHPWAGMRRPPEPADERRIFDLLGHLREKAWALNAEVHALTEETLAVVEASHAALDPWMHEVAYLSSLRGIQHPDLLVRLVDEPSMQALDSFCDALDAFAQSVASLQGWVAGARGVPAETLEQAHAAANVLGPLANQAPTLAAVEDTVASLDGMRARLVHADGLRQRVSQLLGVELPATLGGLAATAEVLALARSAPLAHLPLRNPGIDIEATEHAFRSALHEAQAIWELRTNLTQRFELNLLPPVEELKKHGGACATAGTFRFLSAEYQAARQCHGSFCRAGSPDDPRSLATDFQQLAAYRARLDAFSSNPDFQRVIGPGFRAMDTPFQDVATVRAWQLSVSQTLGWVLPSARSVAERMSAASVDTLRTLATLVPDAAAERNAVQGALAGVQHALTIAGGLAVSPELPLSQGLPTFDQLIGQRRSASQLFRSLGFVPACPTPKLSSAIDALAALSQQRRALDDRADARALLGPAFQGADTPSAPLRLLAQLGRALHQSHLPQPLREWLRHPEFAPRVEQLLQRAQQTLVAVRQLDDVHAQLDSQVQLDRPTWYRLQPIWGDRAVASTVARRAQEALDHVDQLPAWRGMIHSRAALDQQGIGAVVALVESGVIEPAMLWQVCDFLVHDRLATRALQSDPALASFDGMAHGQLQQRFRRYDVDTIEAFRKRAAYLVDRRPVPEGIRTGPLATHTELALIEHESRKQRRQIPIRQLVRRAGGALQALAPCFMMGPRAVAQYLEPGALTFDIVVMDEASQLRPEDALGAICRGRQVAIIGDPLQLPPTSFFDRMSDPDEIDEEQATTFDDAESILDVASSVYSPIRRLRWHYRSRHESLIAFSNEAFYDGSLVVFPSPVAASADLGIRFELVEGAVYQAGRNEMEARRVVDGIITHLRTTPERSLGVVAMNFKQRDLIEELLHARLKDDDVTRAALDASGNGVEPFFVKNLENVQGDERDVIFVSVTYGKGTDGRLLQRFGPLNGAAGPRRLNVLFTRAKRQVGVFCSFDPDELALGSGASAGARALKDYLVHARDRTRNPQDWSDRSPTTDCQRALARALEQHGFEAVPRVGVAGAFLDVAVRRDGQRSGFLLGLQLDGPDYLRSFSARDRDRLRPAALTNLGWKVLSLWSVDWHRDPAGTLQRVLAALDSEGKAL